MRSTFLRCLVAFIVAGPTSTWFAAANDCHPLIDPAKSQYMVGYGSLMESDSKLATEPNAGINLPVLLTGFQRSWNTLGTYPTTFLGVERSESATMVAALYRDFTNDEGKLASDVREIDYCRAAVDPANIKMLDGSAVPGSSQIWIYTTKPARVAAPDAGHPIVQSYVDIFITGCLQMQARVSEKGFDFVEQCVLTTDGWSNHWVNDRIYPRRPFHYEPNAFKIDGYLNRLLPELVQGIRIE
jgi:hypothetical protein